MPDLHSERYRLISPVKTALPALLASINIGHLTEESTAAEIRREHTRRATRRLEVFNNPYVAVYFADRKGEMTAVRRDVEI